MIILLIGAVRAFLGGMGVFAYKLVLKQFQIFLHQPEVFILEEEFLKLSNYD
jgi:hypothetical protein